MNLEDILDELRLLRYKYPLLKKVTQPFVGGLGSSKHNNIIKDLRSGFAEHGLKTLEHFDKVLVKYGYTYSLAFGTMLGAVREHGFIKHDADIDVFMWIEDRDDRFLDILKKEGFKLTHTYSVENGKFGQEDTIEYNEVQIDIFYIYPAVEGQEYSYCCDFVVFEDCLTRKQSIKKHGGLLPRRIEIPIVKEFVKIQFETLTLPVIKNAHEFLSFRYGKDYMTPNPNWVNGQNPYFIPWHEKVALYEEF